MQSSILPRPTRRAFTLIELLTVIAIIGILAAILIPTVGKVRAVAKKANCASNLREIGRLCQFYANDNKGFMPAERNANRSFIGFAFNSSAVPKAYNKACLAYPLWPYYAQTKTVTGGTTATSTPSFIPLLVCPAYENSLSYPGNTLPPEACSTYTLNLALTATPKDPVDGYYVFPYYSRDNAAPAINPGKAISMNNISQLGFSASRVWLLQDYFSATAADYGIALKPVHGTTRNRVYMDGSVRSQPADAANSDLAF